MPAARPLTIAVPKGRVLRALVPLLAKAGLETEALTRDDRTLVRDAGALRFLLLKPADVPTYVEYGAADLGVCGTDVLGERETDLYEPLDLRIGACRMVVAVPEGSLLPRDAFRVATKYPRTAMAFFARKGAVVSVIAVEGSVELAPLAGLADAIVDLVETGETLAQNGLVVVEEVTRVSSVLVANRASFKLRRLEVTPLLAALKGAVGPREARRAGP